MKNGNYGKEEIYLGWPNVRFLPVIRRFSVFQALDVDLLTFFRFLQSTSENAYFLPLMFCWL